MKIQIKTTDSLNDILGKDIPLAAVQGGAGDSDLRLPEHRASECEAGTQNGTGDKSFIATPDNCAMNGDNYEAGTGDFERTEYVLPPGATFREKVFVRQSHIIVQGNMSRIVWNDHNGQTPGFETSDSATVTVLGSDITFKNVIFENDFDYYGMREKRKEESERTGIPMEYLMGLQAVALYTEEHADNITFEHCVFLGFQDTLFTDCITSRFKDCTIYGNVDFIFGRSNALFENCRIVSNGKGFVAAPSTMADKDTGLVFRNCKLTHTDEAEAESVFLARPWHQWGKSGVNSFARFENCSFGSHINRTLWTDMRDSKGVLHHPEDNRFSTENCRFE